MGIVFSRLDQPVNSLAKFLLFGKFPALNVFDFSAVFYYSYFSRFCVVYCNFSCRKTFFSLTKWILRYSLVFSTVTFVSMGHLCFISTECWYVDAWCRYCTNCDYFMLTDTFNFSQTKFKAIILLIALERCQIFAWQFWLFEWLSRPWLFAFRVI